MRHNTLLRRWGTLLKLSCHGAATTTTGARPPTLARTASGALAPRTAVALRNLTTALDAMEGILTGRSKPRAAPDNGHAQDATIQMGRPTTYASVHKAIERGEPWAGLKLCDMQANGYPRFVEGPTVGRMFQAAARTLVSDSRVALGLPRAGVGVG